MLVEGLGGRGERGLVDRRSSGEMFRLPAPLQRLLSGPVTLRVVAAALRAVRCNAGDLPSTGLSTVHGHGKEACAQD
jgi:hypothetical protein